MARDIDIESISDEGVVRIWEAVMEQVAKDYIDCYIEYLKFGPDSVGDYQYGKRRIPIKIRIIELEDYICGDLIAGPHAKYIIHGLRKEAEEHVKDGRKRRKEIIRRG